MNKIDLVDAKLFRQESPNDNEVLVSAKTSAGLDALRSALLNAVGWGGSGEGVFMARERHLQALQLATHHLDRAGALTRELELFAEELKQSSLKLQIKTSERNLQQTARLVASGSIANSEHEDSKVAFELLEKEHDALVAEEANILEAMNFKQNVQSGSTKTVIAPAAGMVTPSTRFSPR